MMEIKEKIRITKGFHFEAAHALDGYNGKCKDIHGHSYHLEVTVIGYPEVDTRQPNCGMVMDFKDLKKVINDSVLNLFDHHLLLRRDSRFKGIEAQNKRVRYVNYQPTCENMLLEIVSILKHQIRDDIKLAQVFLRETKTSYTVWQMEDNK